MTEKKTRDVLLRITYDADQRFEDKWGTDRLMKIADPILWDYAALLTENDEGVDVDIEVIDPEREPISRSLDQVRIFCETLSLEDDVPAEDEPWHDGYRHALQDVLKWIDTPTVVMRHVGGEVECANCFDTVIDASDFGLFHASSGHPLCDPNNVETSTKAELPKETDE